MTNFKILCSIFCLLNVLNLLAQTTMQVTMQTTNSSAQKTNVFVSAHPDDWQLFMNPNAYHSIKNSVDSVDNAGKILKYGEKVIFIHTTSGDGGNAGSDYYTAREQASLRAIRFLRNVSTRNGTNLGMDMKEETVTLTGFPAEVQHYVLKYTYDNIAIYFLRLPDGGIEGKEPQSMKKLYDGDIPHVTTVGGGNRYHSRDDFKNTLKSIITKEATGQITFHMADTDLEINPGDHSDHIYSAKFMDDVVKELPSGSNKINYYQDYCTESKEPNITVKDDLWINIATWGVTGSGLTDYKSIYGTTWDKSHNSWVDKQYYRPVIK
jgi:hypothetical protein